MTKKSAPKRPGVAGGTDDPTDRQCVIETLLRQLEAMTLVARHYWASLDEGEVSDDVSPLIREADLALARARMLFAPRLREGDQRWIRQKQ